ncbi:unnamed protein product [Ixodes pacificus]
MTSTILYIYYSIVSITCYKCKIFEIYNVCSLLVGLTKHDINENLKKKSNMPFWRNQHFFFYLNNMFFAKSFLFLLCSLYMLRSNIYKNNKTKNTSELACMILSEHSPRNFREHIQQKAVRTRGDTITWLHTELQNVSWKLTKLL